MSLPRACAAVLLLACVPALAHEGDGEALAMRLHGLLLQLDRTWAQAGREADPAGRDALLQAHARLLVDAQESLRDIADKSPCILMEKQDSARHLACLVDAEARLQATEKLLGHVMRRLALPGGR